MNSSLKRHKDVTLPSIEGGFGTLNITKDPPKGIHTRRIIKVGEDMDIINKIEGSNDRNNETIQKYGRGINPMVSVSYSNYSNNSGSNPLQRSSRVQSSLPVKILHQGAFRPPVNTPRELFPITKFQTKPSSIITNKTRDDYSKRVVRESKYMKEINKNNIKILDVKPTKVYIKQQSLPSMNTDKYIHDNIIKVNVNSGKIMKDSTLQNNRISGREILNRNHYNIDSNKGTTNYTKNIDTKINTDKFIHDIKLSNVVTNPKINIDKNDYTRNVELNRNIPVYDVSTNLGKQGDSFVNQSRQVSLQPKLQVNHSVSSNASIPWNNKENSIINLENKITKINKERYNMSVSRM